MKGTILFKMVIVITLMLFLFPFMVSAHVWEITTVDSDDGGWVGYSTSLALDTSNNPHISYYDNISYDNGDLKYAHYDGSWHTETVDSGGVVGSCTSLALDTSNNPHISYFDDSNDDLKYAYYDGSWHTETVDNVGFFGTTTSLALDTSDNPHISYYDYTNRDLKYAHYDGSWHTIKVADTGMMSHSLALDTSNNPHISYYGPRYAYYDGSWHTETVDNAGGPTSLALDTSDNPHISYCDYSNGDLKYAYYDGSWHTETVDNVGFFGTTTSLALDTSNNPHISYYRNYSLLYAYYDGSWHKEKVDSPVYMNTPSLALDTSNNPHISYFDDSNNDLKYAYLRVCPDDFDCDGIFDSDDNCPHVANPNQKDADEDGVGDVCDNCQQTPNGLDLGTCYSWSAMESGTMCNDDGDCETGESCQKNQEDYDGDVVGDVCDNCPQDTYANQEDTDDDGIGNVCDNCPSAANPNQIDADGDGIGDVCDQCPYDSNNDIDGDGICGDIDTCPNDPDNDMDGDGICGDVDNCPDVANLDQADSDNDGIGDICDERPNDPDLLSAADGHYEFGFDNCSGGGWGGWCDCVDYRFCRGAGIIVGSGGSMYYGPCDTWYGYSQKGVIEFDISSIEGLYARGYLQAVLSLTVKDVFGDDDQSLFLYNISDGDEDGIIGCDDFSDTRIGSIFIDFQPGDIITFDVTSAVEHDLFDPDQTRFSGFVLSGDDIVFYDHTDPMNGPRLNVWSECTTNSDCLDGLYCNGLETCVMGRCNPGNDRCQDDDLFCNGDEICDEKNDVCVNTGNPCVPELFCDEENDSCAACFGDVDCDDELFCNGEETCEDGDCQLGSNPCTDDGNYCNGVELCDEEANECVRTGNPCEDDHICNELNDTCEVLSVERIECSTNALGSDFFLLLGVVTIKGTETSFTMLESQVNYDPPMLIPLFKLVNPATQIITQVVFVLPSIILPSVPSYPTTVTVTVNGLSDDMEIGAFIF